MIDDAGNVLGLLSLPSGIVTGVLLVLSWKAINANQERIAQRHIRMATGTSLAAVLVMAVLVVAMAPLALRALDPAGSPHPVLVIYWLVFVIALGVLGVSGYTVWRARAEARR